MKAESHLLEDLPPEIQAAIKRRDAVIHPMNDAVTSLGLTWEIAGGRREQ